ncbi:bifunctional 4-hydroxy-2-oxoglutarate aldolase/2-dehydro-3-deoxy-phosphogluconate aldolase [Paenibacillus arenosi]|uniref:Bifunctional 4-hydroxy-2-oxoglutarate aldolase/2-dehydro-3-deoxy-phosphogluconate aldolase n=1 Tax=Paenibacillus arenosi TaxID=2774142 RepID=A0ABR9AWM5_9BACL|nr:bifunctional 4-hydroxy-2-oxoglutarate aldolase/2-dehydro-3-deoxy-phosphogluconate aldolase [Paenibacillus arenosi]MBD8498402.1 bifunctional 4-hydroxy-2-oxoglutarate aldolase/2-dehydro-3-deoxy-phosphogluconate aldolase [Paenibacillus arenosi]
MSKAAPYLHTAATAELLHQRIVAIFRGYTGEAADEAAAALIRGGITLLEVTMNTDGAAAIVSRWRERFGEQVFIGAGTVIDEETAREALDSGAQFLITPNLDEKVIELAHSRGIDVWPGVLTPTEMVRAWKAGAPVLKLFPLGSLGSEYIREVRGPLGHIPLMATGGIDLHNVQQYWTAGASAFGLGSKLVRGDFIRAAAWQELEEHASEWVNTVRHLT